MNSVYKFYHEKNIKSCGHTREQKRVADSRRDFSLIEDAFHEYETEKRTNHRAKQIEEMGVTEFHEKQREYIRGIRAKNLEEFGTTMPNRHTEQTRELLNQRKKESEMALQEFIAMGYDETGKEKNIRQIANKYETITIENLRRIVIEYEKNNPDFKNAQLIVQLKKPKRSQTDEFIKTFFDDKKFYKSIQSKLRKHLEKFPTLSIEYMTKLIREEKKRSL